MKILFTGASSLTGMWFVEELAKGGHEVTSCFRSSLESYSGLRLQRISRLRGLCRELYNCPFGSDAFLEAIAQGDHWDLFCHHAADVSNYKSPDFDAAAALSSNTHRLKDVLRALKEKGCRRVLLTGSVFEQNEGAGSEQLHAVSPYGLSKGLTSEVFRFYNSLLGMRLGKFVIPNPFGPYEEPRFTTYLIRSWYSGQTPAVNTPDYVRDNIPVSLLAKAYRAFAERLADQPGYEQYNPSYYVESQGAFTERFAREMQSRLSLPCRFELKAQTDFSEPRVRINHDTLNPLTLGWSESHAWDQLADYYANS